MRHLIQGTDFTLRYPQALRPWQHVLEPLYGYLKLAYKLYHHPKDFAQAWNFGPNADDVKNVGWIVNSIAQLWDSNLNISYEQQPQPHETSLLILDSTKAQRLLNWHPVWPLATGLKKTIDWYSSYQKGEDMYQKTLAQIDEYNHLIG